MTWIVSSSTIDIFFITTKFSKILSKFTVFGYAFEIFFFENFQKRVSFESIFENLIISKKCNNRWTQYQVRLYLGCCSLSRLFVTTRVSSNKPRYRMKFRFSKIAFSCILVIIHISLSPFNGFGFTMTNNTSINNATIFAFQQKQFLAAIPLTWILTSLTIFGSAVIISYLKSKPLLSQSVMDFANKIFFIFSTTHSLLISIFLTFTLTLGP